MMHGRVFVLSATGRKYVAREGTCLACKYCSDVFWDFTNGPYMAFCSKGFVWSEVSICAKCPYFKADKTLRRVKFETTSKH